MSKKINRVNPEHEKELLKAAILNAQIQLSKGRTRFEDGRRIEVELTSLRTKLRELESK